MKLKTETNTAEMYERVLSAAEEYFSSGYPFQINAHFEHGQWWVIVSEIRDEDDFCDDDEISYSVCDAEGGDSVDGFTFERVS